MTAEPSTTPEQPLVWIDLEMTGLDPDRHVIVEIAVIVTDGSLTELHEGPDLVIGATDEDLAAKLDAFRADMKAQIEAMDAEVSGA